LVSGWVYLGEKVQVKPTVIYDTIETLLPDADAGGRLLQLWAPEEFRRSLWTCVHEQTEE
jgi:hypothetical protein